MTVEDLRQHHADAERRAVLTELDAIDAALDVIQREYGSHPDIDDTRARTHALRVQWLASAPTVH